MKFDIFFTLSGPGGTKEIPNTNPATCSDLKTLLKILSDNLPDYSKLGVEMVGVRIIQKDS